VLGSCFFSFQVPARMFLFTIFLLKKKDNNNKSIIAMGIVQLQMDLQITKIVIQEIVKLKKVT